MNFIPKWIAWEMTRRCNLRCVHCRSSSEKVIHQHPDFSTAQAFQVIDDIVRFAKPVLVLSGGEPLLRKDIFQIADYGSNKGLKMCLATNGSLVNDQVCEQIKESGIQIVSLSLDGASAEIHDAFRCQAGAFQSTLAAAVLFKKHNIDFIINSSFTKHNQDDIEKTYRLSKELGATAWYLFMVVPTGRAEEMINTLISVDDYDAILDWHYQMEKAESDILVRPTCAPHYYRIALQDNKKTGVKYQRRALKFSTGGSKGCLAGQLICLIDVDGEVLPCSYFHRSAGNVFKQSFQSIWEDSPLMHDMRDFQRYKGRCGECEYLNVCGGCRARAYALTGDYLEQEPMCRYIPIRHQEK
jgi:AdoMet-dependent heme synthase